MCPECTACTSAVFLFHWTIPPSPQLVRPKTWGILDLSLPFTSGLQGPAGSGSRLAPEPALRTVHLDLEPHRRRHILTYLHIFTVFFLLLPPFLSFSAIHDWSHWFQVSLPDLCLCGFEEHWYFSSSGTHHAGLLHLPWEGLVYCCLRCTERSAWPVIGAQQIFVTNSWHWLRILYQVPC